MSYGASTYVKVLCSSVEENVPCSCGSGGKKNISLTALDITPKECLFCFHYLLNEVLERQLQAEDNTFGRADLKVTEQIVCRSLEADELSVRKEQVAAWIDGYTTFHPACQFTASQGDLGQPSPVSCGITQYREGNIVLI